MNDTSLDQMAEATRLTLQGRLAEATALIQRTLGSAAAPSTEPRNGDATLEPIEGSARLVVDALRAAPAPAPRPERPVRTPDAAMPPLHRAGARTRNPGMPSDTPFIRGFPEMLRQRPRAAGPPPSAGQSAGRFAEASYSGLAGSRAYRLYVPGGYTGHAAPLLIMLHGCTQSAEDFASGTQMNILAERHTFLVAYPAQAATANPSRCWNWFEAGHQSRAQGEPAIIAGISQQVMATYNIDARRVYVAGLSAGGAMAAVLGVTYPDLYAAVGVHSGLAYGAAGDLVSAMAALQRGGSGPTLPGAQSSAAPGLLSRIAPLILFHGERDTTVSPRNAELLVAQWIAAQGASGEPEASEQLAGGQRALRTIYRDANGQSLVEQWRVQGLGHAWFGGSASGSYTDAQGPDASSEMVRFFTEHPRA